MSLYRDTYLLIQTYHKDQTYGDGSYIDAHLVPVSLTAKWIAEGCKLTKEEIEGIEVLGLLHDIIEDTSCTLTEVRAVENMPKWVPEGIWALTKDMHMSYNNYLGFIVQGGIYPIIVKLADSMCNHRACLSEGNVEKAKKYSSNIDYLTTALGREVEKRRKSKS